MNFHVGDIAEVESVVTNKAGVAVKPVSFVLNVKRPNNEIDVITCTEPSTGKFEGTYEFTEAGPYVFSAKPGKPGETPLYKASEPHSVTVKGEYDVT